MVSTISGITVQSRHSLQINFRIVPEEILRRNHLLPQHWTHVESDQQRFRYGCSAQLTIAIITLDEQVQIGNILKRVRELSSSFSGSGAWVREAYLQAFPDYDGRGAILFPDNESHWRYELDPEKKVHTTGIWHDFGKTGRRSMDPLTDLWRNDRRIALIGS